MTQSRPSVLVLGAGGHARVVAAMLAARKDIELAGVLDRDRSTLGEAIGTTSVVGSFDELSDWASKGVGAVAVAIGDNLERSEWFAKIRETGLDVMPLHHPTALVDPTARIGPGVTICMGAIVGVEAEVGEGAIINSGAIVDHESRIGAFAHIAPGCRLAGRVRVGDRSFVGLGSVVRDKITIGADVIIGAGSAVVSDIPDGTTAMGVPAEVVRG